MGIIDYVKSWFFNIDWISTAQIREMMDYIITDAPMKEQMEKGYRFQNA